MNSLRIDTGTVRIMVNDDENRVIEFNPTDVLFVEKFYNLIKKFEEKEEDYRKQIEEITSNKEVDPYGLPINTEATLKIILEICNFLRSQIDQVFGEGTSEKAFGSNQTLNMFEQFFTGITPYIQEARAEKTSKYVVTR